MTQTYALLAISKEAHNEILRRLREIGPEYVRDYTDVNEHGVVICLTDVGLVVENKK